MQTEQENSDNTSIHTKQEIQVDFGNGVTREMLHDGKVVVYTINKMTRVALDSWVEASLDSLTHYAEDQTLRVIHHVSSLREMLSPYARQSIQRVTNASENYQGYTAIVIQSSITAQLLKIIMRQVSRVVRQWTVRFFTDKEKAMEWLLEQPDK